MIEYKVVSEEGRRSAARIYHAERIIELGCDLAYFNGIIHTDRVWSFYNQFKNMEEYYEKHVDAIITHEIIHSIIYPSEGPVASNAFDNIDNNHEVSFAFGDKV